MTARVQLAPPPAAAELIARIGWLIRLRWVAIAGVSVFLQLVPPLFEVELELGRLYAVIAALAVYNLAMTWTARHLAGRGSPLLHAGRLARALLPDALQGAPGEAEATRAAVFANLQISVDLVALATLLHFGGGIENPFMAFFVFHVVVASILLSRRATYLQTGLAVVAVSVVGWGECLGALVHYPLDGVWRAGAHREPLLVGAELAVFATTLSIAAYMGSTIAARLREREAEAARLARAVEVKAVQLEAALARMSHMEKVKSEYMRRVAHELRGPLGTIRTAISVVLSGAGANLAAEMRDLLVRAGGRSRQLAETVNDLLDLSRAREAPSAAARRLVDLAALARQLAAELEATAAGLGCALAVDAPPDVPPVYGDPAGLEALVRNLLDNALRYGAGGGQIDLRLRHSDGRLRLEVADRGIGIEPDALAHVYEEFFRSPGARAHSAEGTGLGLAIVRGVVDQHGGTIAIDSAPGTGTRVIVDLPARSA